MSGTIPERPSVLDATVLSNFAYLDRVSGLQTLARPITTPAVRDEITTGAEQYPFLANATAALTDTIPVITLDNASREQYNRLLDDIDRGEAEALAVADCHDGLLVTDDGSARSLAREHAVRFTGSIGVLIELVERDKLDEGTADRLLKLLIDETDYRAPSRELSDYL